MNHLRRVLAWSIDVAQLALVAIATVCIVAGKLLEVIRLRVLPPEDRRRLIPTIPPVEAPECAPQHLGP